MFATAYRRRNRSITLQMMAIGGAAALIYTILSDGFAKPMPLVNAMIGGPLLGLYTSLIELRLLTSRFRRKITFIPLLILRLFIYSIMTLAILFLVLSISRALWQNRSYQEILSDPDFIHYLLEEDFLIVNLYGIAVISVVAFTYQITRKIGPRFLVNMITGKYYHPRKSEMIFLFLHIRNGNEISRKLGLLNYFNFVNDIIFDITPPIAAFKSHIYQYVDNEMVLYWYPKDGYDQAACIRAYFAMCDMLYEKRETYFARYEVYPEINAAAHSGEVVQGEIGHGKTEIDFYGDVLNTTSRMSQFTSDDNPFLISKELLSQISLPPIYEAIHFESMTLRGKSRAVDLFHIKESSFKSMPDETKE